MLLLASQSPGSAQGLSMTSPHYAHPAENDVLCIALTVPVAAQVSSAAAPPAPAAAEPLGALGRHRLTERLVERGRCGRENGVANEGQT